jgi:hypothetical protein
MDRVHILHYNCKTYICVFLFIRQAFMKGYNSDPFLCSPIFLKGINQVCPSQKVSCQLYVCLSCRFCIYFYHFSIRFWHCSHCVFVVFHFICSLSVTSTFKTDLHDITEVALNIITLTQINFSLSSFKNICGNAYHTVLVLKKNVHFNICIQIY